MSNDVLRFFGSDISGWLGATRWRNGPASVNGPECPNAYIGAFSRFVVSSTSGIEISLLFSMLGTRI